jgi:hypothetical protein
MKYHTTLLLLLLLLTCTFTACDVPGDGAETGGGETTLSETLAPAQAPPYVPEPIHGEYFFVIDASADAGVPDPVTGHIPFRLAAADIISTLNTLTINDGFDVMTFGGGTVTQSLYGTLHRVTPQAIRHTIQFLAAVQPGGPSPQYSALHDMTVIAPPSVNLVYFYSASMPGLDPAAPGGVATPANIFAAFPGWWSVMTDASLYCVRVGATSTNHEAYMQNLAALAGGSYLTLP